MEFEEQHRVPMPSEVLRCGANVFVMVRVMLVYGILSTARSWKYRADRSVGLHPTFTTSAVSQVLLEELSTLDSRACRESGLRRGSCDYSKERTGRRIERVVPAVGRAGHFSGEVGNRPLQTFQNI
jgi:hypothetical protein